MALQTNTVFIKLTSDTNYVFNFPIQCAFVRYQYDPDEKDEAKQTTPVDNFNVIVNNNNELINGITLALTNQDSNKNRYRLSLTCEDNQGLQLKCITPVMLTHTGEVNLILPQHLNTFYMKLG